MSGITGITLIRNGNKLKYPYKECIKQLSLFCDEVLVNCGDSDDNTFEDIKALNLDNVKVFQTTWNMSNTGDGGELARQANLLLPIAQGSWIVYMQADELLHEKDFDIIKNALYQSTHSINQIELYRTYFWTFKQRAPKYEIYLGRIFRRNTHEVGGDGMYIQSIQGNIPLVARLKVPIYHYSRVGTEEEINTRWRNLDLLFHNKEVVDTFSKFSYTDIDKKELIPFNGTHPKVIQGLLNE
jgi:hypothetical protein